MFKISKVRLCYKYLHRPSIFPLPDIIFEKKILPRLQRFDLEVLVILIILAIEHNWFILEMISCLALMFTIS